MRNKIIASLVGAFFMATLIAPLAADAKYHVPDLLKAKRAQSVSVEKATHSDPATLCPVSGKKADKSQYIAYEGKKVYFCCKNCEKPFLQDPSKYMEKHRKSGKTDAPWRGKYRS